MYINFAPSKVYSDDVLVRVFYKEKTIINGLDYKEVKYQNNPHTQHLTPEGYRRGEQFLSWKIFRRWIWVA